MFYERRVRKREEKRKSYPVKVQSFVNLSFAFIFLMFQNISKLGAKNCTLREIIEIQ